MGKWTQRVYTLRQGEYEGNQEPVIGQGYRVIKITNALFEKNNVILDNKFLLSKILEFWSSPESFLRNGIGYCIIYQKEIVSICFSGFVAGNVHCIDIETLQAHQGKKLAQMAAHCFVKECLKNNMVPYWDCMELNKPSVAVAKSIGLKNEFNYVGYDFPLE